MEDFELLKSLWDHISLIENISQDRDFFFIEYYIIWNKNISFIIEALVPFVGRGLSQEDTLNASES